MSDPPVADRKEDERQRRERTMRHAFGLVEDKVQVDKLTGGAR